MKKCLAVTMVIIICLSFAFSAMAAQTNEYVVGNTLTLGHYEQDNNPDNGKEPVEWIVLDVQDKQALLISKYGLEARAFNKAFVRMTWAECDLRTWMNGTFMNELFSAEEQSRIVTVTNVNADNPHYSTKGGDDTTDQIFLLSLAEAEKYFPEKSSRTVRATEYAKAQGAFVNEKNGNSWWLLRTPGVRPIDICGVSADGRISGYGSRDVNRPSGVIRAVLWVTFGD